MVEKHSTEDIVLDYIRALLYGPPKSGKTESLDTLPKPTFVYCFASQEVTTLKGRKDIDYMVFQESNPKNPTAFNRFNDHFKRFVTDELKGPNGPNYASLAFDPIGGLQSIVMDFHMANVGAAGQIPLWERDFMPTKITLGNILRVVTSLPIHFVLTAHSGTDKDSISGKVLGFPIVVGDMKQTLGGMFDELYYMYATTKQGKRVYRFVTQDNGIYPAGTRIGQRGLFKVFERPDFSYLLEKAEKGGEPGSEVLSEEEESKEKVKEEEEPAVIPSKFE